MARFQTKIQKARFVVSGLSSLQMQRLANNFNTGMIQRIQSGLNISDEPAKPLRPGYEKFKAKKYPPAIRNMTLTGRTLRSSKVLTVSENKATIGFTDPVAERRAHFANRIDRQWGASPNDIQGFVQDIHNLKLVSVVKVA